MANWEQYFDKIVCRRNINDKCCGILPYYFIYNNKEFYPVKSPVIYMYRNRNVTKLEDNLPMPPTDSFEHMFTYCESLTNINALKNWDTRNVINVSNMFLVCRSLSNIDALKNWDMRNVKYMDGMFNSGVSLSSYPKNLDELKEFTAKL